ncbi:MAG: transcription antitermination factor NusB [Bacteroidota bacterium]|nr:transcription antitermination factor NusB [Bacteroidota bacterium]
MLTRRQFRIKVLQAVYAFHQGEGERIDVAERQLLKSIERIHELYIYQLSLLVELTDFFKTRLEESKSKFLPSQEDLNPNTRFVDNLFMSQLSSNVHLLKYREQFKISWNEEMELIRKFYQAVRESDFYKNYMSNPECGYKDDKDVFLRIFNDIIAESSVLQSIYEEKSIYWIDDLELANFMVNKTIKGYRATWDNLAELPYVYKSNDSNDPDSDKEFVVRLFRKTIVNNDELEKLVDQKAQNWDVERIAIIDILLLKMALAELIEFPSIPVKVTLNEYIELAKIYSSPRSNVFINGILDKLILELKENGRIVKSGRGLME